MLLTDAAWQAALYQNQALLFVVDGALGILEYQGNDHEHVHAPGVAYHACIQFKSELLDQWTFS